MFFKTFGPFADLMVDPDWMRQGESMVTARAKGKLRRKRPTNSDKREKEMRRVHETGGYSTSDHAELFDTLQPTAHRTLARKPA